MQKTLRRFPHAAVIMELHLQRDPPQPVGFLHEIEHAGYLLRSINYEGEVVPVAADTILAQPQEYWTLLIQKKLVLTRGRQVRVGRAPISEPLLSGSERRIEPAYDLKRQT
ncbi:hypothetical protein Isop_3361 [Isosphaera pallida ATCC 43644]|uniref:Uncharacterized protein n=1 Tax=Isosphaera pallida (strain ATCC 43644 / DSM 9630 / IS1B) TaxID=575540 RepID=E8R621_ISOPI|nr:hypothetical protein [Isosphaera pallida]ADV63923.1 hypothetical protein Isop_3361 [Isosphaera pallida ATCC 43644]